MLLILFDVYIATLSVITPAGIVSSGRAAHILIRAVTRSAESHQASDSSEALQFLPLLSSTLHTSTPFSEFASYQTFLSHLFIFL